MTCACSGLEAHEVVIRFREVKMNREILTKMFTIFICWNIGFNLILKLISIIKF